MGSITLKRVSKVFGEAKVIPSIDLEINDGEFVVFVGPSGCGKSTLLRLIAGLEDVSGGQILIDGKDMTGNAPAERGLAMVFQSYALYPHMSVRNNIAFPLKMAKLDKALIDRKVTDAARVLNLTDYLERRPSQLSGGQRQRVAIGRAIVREPSAFLFDEPLSNLDAALRGTMRLEISELHQQLATTMIYVTHDQVEAMTMADKIVVLNRGNIEQVGSPLDLYRSPRNLFVAGFIGSPRMNLVTGAYAKALDAHTIGVRPEHVTLSHESGEWKGTVNVAEHLGSDTFLHVEIDGIGPITVRAGGEFSCRHGDTVYVTPDRTRIHRFNADGLAIGSIAGAAGA
ncbi:ABC transporter ATP-binding protein [Rhizobium sp. BK251]|uniref:ABC transporter ATP-binding protein n=1 Tax=Rhizobium sp. BK251 TaxID=2512125 RepID=UPI001050AB2F|nr:ABC transporter ATP-binding protein [Rhizobium sp. BK251]TCL69549.1 sorbitol ABC transporter ATP-binding protein /mannitol ABC transporter ATP-binding protein [Rhizobium sp. BK251]